MPSNPSAKRAEVRELDPEYVAAIEEARADVDAGRTVSYEAFRAWLLSWGKKDRLPPPECD